MKKILLLLLESIPFYSFSETFYYEQPTKLAGKLSSVKSHHPNPEFAGKAQPTIFLAQPIDVLPAENDQFNDPEHGVTKIQLSYDLKIQKKIKAYKNKQVSVLCSDLFHAHTGHHTTEVLCTVKEINLIK